MAWGFTIKTKSATIPKLNNKPFFKPKFRKERTWINDQIRAQEVRVTNEQGESLGVFKLEEAIKMAKDQGLDLVEVVPNANPPITKITSFDKYRYQKDKKDKEERKAQKTAGIKRVQITVRAAKNDLEVKLRQLEKFMNDGHQVEIYVRLRGREKGQKDWAKKKLNEFLGMISVEYKTIGEPKFGGGGLLIQILPKK